MNDTVSSTARRDERASKGGAVEKGKSGMNKKTRAETVTIGKKLELKVKRRRKMRRLERRKGKRTREITTREKT